VGNLNEQGIGYQPPHQGEYRFGFKPEGPEVTVAELKKTSFYQPTKNFITDHLLSADAQNYYPDSLKDKEGKKPTHAEIMEALAEELSHTGPRQGEDRNWAWEIVHHLGDDVAIPPGENLLDVLHAEIAVARKKEEREGGGDFNREHHQVTESPHHLPGEVGRDSQFVAGASGELAYFNEGKVDIHARADMIAGRLIVDQFITQEIPADFDPEKLTFGGKAIDPEAAALIDQIIEERQEKDDQGNVAKQPTYKEVMRALRDKVKPANTPDPEERMRAKKGEYMLRGWVYETTETALKYRPLVAEEGGEWIKSHDTAEDHLENFKAKNPQAYSLAKRLTPSQTRQSLLRMIDDFNRFGGDPANDTIVKLVAQHLPAGEWQKKIAAAKTPEEKQRVVSQMIDTGDRQTLHALTSHLYDLALKGMERWRRTAVEPIRTRRPAVDESQVKIRRVKFVEAVKRERMDDNRGEDDNTDGGDGPNTEEEGVDEGKETTPTVLPDQIFAREEREKVGLPPIEKLTETNAAIKELIEGYREQVTKRRESLEANKEDEERLSQLLSSQQKDQVLHRKLADDEPLDDPDLQENNREILRQSAAVVEELTTARGNFQEKIRRIERGVKYREDREEYLGHKQTLIGLAQELVENKEDPRKPGTGITIEQTSREDFTRIKEAFPDLTDRVLVETVVVIGRLDKKTLPRSERKAIKNIGETAEQMVRSLESATDNPWDANEHDLNLLAVKRALLYGSLHEQQQRESQYGRGVAEWQEAYSAVKTQVETGQTPADFEKNKEVIETVGGTDEVRQAREVVEATIQKALRETREEGRPHLLTFEEWWGLDGSVEAIARALEEAQGWNGAQHPANKQAVAETILFSTLQSMEPVQPIPAQVKTPISVPEPTPTEPATPPEVEPTAPTPIPPPMVPQAQTAPATEETPPPAESAPSPTTPVTATAATESAVTPEADNRLEISPPVESAEEEGVRNKLRKLIKEAARAGEGAKRRVVKAGGAAKKLGGAGRERVGKRTAGGRRKMSRGRAALGRKIGEAGEKIKGLKGRLRKGHPEKEINLQNKPLERAASGIKGIINRDGRLDGEQRRFLTDQVNQAANFIDQNGTEPIKGPPTDSERKAMDKLERAIGELHKKGMIGEIDTKAILYLVRMVNNPDLSGIGLLTNDGRLTRTALVIYGLIADWRKLISSSEK